MSETFSTEVAGRKLTVEIGRMAKQSHGSCTVQYGDTVVLASAVMGGVREGVDFFPLSVDYEERLYAAGKIKGSRWVKREGRPSDESVLTGRLVDRAIRPLFPYELKNEVQVITTVLSFDQENDADVVALIAASIALAISQIPWAGPLAGVRVGQVDGQWILNPSFVEREKSLLDLVIAGRDSKTIMIEAEGNEAPEAVVYDAIVFAQKEISSIVTFIEGIVAKVGKPKAEIVAPVVVADDESSAAATTEVTTKTQQWLTDNVAKVLFDKTLPTKTERLGALKKAKQELMAYLEAAGIGKDRRKLAEPLFEDYVEAQVSRAIVDSGIRVDGRAIDQIRPLAAEVGILPRTHGSALFSRGETQVLSIATLGSPGDEQFLEGLEEDSRKRFMHHYNFPPYSVGEVKRLMGPSRRDIGHGELAEKAIRRMMPSKEEFPYTVRVVSEVLGSNGSSSMGSTCGATLALMDAGVPIKKPIAGIAMGMGSNEKEGKYRVLTDLQDLEDGDGGMDFKIAGSRDGITAIQLDTKTSGLPLDVVQQTLTQGKIARLQILDVMAAALTAPRTELSQYAPRIISFKIDPNKIREVIGPGGKIINEIIDATGVEIDIEQDGLVMITSTNAEGAQRAVDWVKNIVKEVMPGEVYEGKVTRILDFGAIVELLPGKDGMVHISEMAAERVNAVEDIVKLGDTVKVKVLSVEDGRTSLSIKALLPGADQNQDSRPRPPRSGGFDRNRGPRPGGHR
jgi:polyribonucleotide nucleotidyltransferase